MSEPRARPDPKRRKTVRHTPQKPFPKKQRLRKTYSLSLDPDVVKDLDAMAEAHSVTRSHMVEILIERAVEQQE